ncbi:CHAT domain-containing protein [Reichenbachiella ulvae]|uniref:CHAT domain-containing protein n=1 Tax=Reichenbachiella ulvae TaxID=2980104 RepID=A0ABT3CXW2_9BACT|nr:CHAT domain-containing protein [Reichenbachiella ulvae]MCV9388536.1 CHAT domain-containing protein [Reichenbachiella ulvae]
MLILILASHAAVSQDWAELYKQGEEAYTKYDYELAKQKSIEALVSCQSDLGENHANTAAIYRQLTLICFEAGWIEEGLTYVEKELKVQEAIGNRDKEVYAVALYNKGLLLSMTDGLAQSQEAFKDALDLYLVYFDSNSASVAEVQGNLAMVFYYDNQMVKADSLFELSYEVLNRQDQVSPEFFNITYIYSELKLLQGDFERSIALLSELESFFDPDALELDYARLLVKQGRAYEDNEQLTIATDKYLKAHQVFTKLDAHNDPDNLIAINGLSILYMKEGRLKEATELLEGLVDKLSGEKEEAYLIALTDLGKVHFLNYEFDRAYSCFEEVKLRGSDNEDAYFGAWSGLALVDLERGQFNEALDEINQALLEVDEQSDWRKNLLESKAAALTALGRYKESEAILNESIHLSRENEAKVIDLKLSMAVLYTTMQDLNRAGELFEEIKEHYEKESSTARLEYASFLGNYASYLQSSNSFFDAEIALIQSMEIKKELLGETNENYLATYENLALLYIVKGKYESARLILEETMGIKKSLGSQAPPSQLAYTYHYLGVIAKSQGEYSQAEEFIKKSLELYKEEFGSHHVFYANTANELGLLYLKMGNLKAAKPLFESSMEIFKEIHSDQHIDYASSLENLAALYEMEGDLEKSKELLERVLAIDKVQLGTQHPLYSKTLNNLAATLEEMGEYEKASRLYEESIRIYESLFGTDHPSFANTLYNIAVLEQEIGNYEGAKVHFEEVIRIRKEILNENHPDLAYAIYGLASVKQRLEDYEGAREDYGFALDNYLAAIQNYFPSLSEEEKSAFYGKIKPVFEAYKDFAIEYVYHGFGNQTYQQEVLENLYNLQLSTKALLLNATKKVKDRILNSGDEALIAQYIAWKSTKEDLVKALNMSKSELAINNFDIAELQTRSNEIEKELSKKSGVFAGQYDQSLVKMSDVQQNLVEGEVALELLRVKKNTKNDSIYYAGLVLKSQGVPELVVITEGEEMESKYFKQYKNMVVFKMDNQRSYSQYWKNIDDKLQGVQKLFLSTDGVYNKININTLYDPENQEYVFDKYDIRLLSNTRDLVIEQSKETSQLTVRKAAIFGYPDYTMGGASAAGTKASTERGFADGITELPGTLEETNHISQTLDQNFWKYDLFQRAEANEENIKALHSPKLLHIATHGFFMSNMNVLFNANEGIQSREAEFNPLFRSGLLLAGASKTFQHQKLPGTEDGILTAYEAMNLDLDQTELVVMSACETGLGEVKNGEGVYGLQRALLVAGAENLIMSLWKVNDETTQKLMSMFYDNWLGGQTKQAAFHDAIAELKKEYKEPYYWGAFVMLGL